MLVGWSGLRGLFVEERPYVRRGTEPRQIRRWNHRRRGAGTGRREKARGERKTGRRAALGTESEITDRRVRKPAPKRGELRKRSVRQTVESRLRSRDIPQRRKAEIRQKKGLRPRSERPAPGREQAQGQGDVSSLFPLLAWKSEKPPAETSRENMFYTKGARETACRRGRRSSPCCPPGELTPVHSQGVCHP